MEGYSRDKVCVNVYLKFVASRTGAQFLMVLFVMIAMASTWELSIPPPPQRQDQQHQHRGY
jgi:hypothetical protein